MDVQARKLTTTVLSHTRGRIILGAIALLPLIAVGYMGYEVFTILQEVISPLSDRLGVYPILNFFLLVILALAAVIGICYGFGWLITTRLGAASFEKAEGRIKDMVPGYEFLAKLLKGMAKEQATYQPALVTLGAPGTAVLGFVMEEPDDDDPYATVFVPTAPILTAGAIHVVERSRIQEIEGTASDAANYVTKWGLGLRQFRGKVKPLTQIPPPAD